MNTPTKQSPKTLDYIDRHNPDAWRDCSIPPTAWNDRHQPSFRTWRSDDEPAEAITNHLKRANGMLTFLDSQPRFEMNHADVRGLMELIGAIGECLDLAGNAAEVALASTGEIEPAP
ncbi:MAG: hypothetical protein H7837_14440 [Magnetococcus sp. MYC-9]